MADIQPVLLNLGTSLPVDWEKTEESWYTETYYPLQYSVLSSMGSLWAAAEEKQIGPHTSYLRYRSKWSEEIRKVQWVAHALLPHSSWKGWASELIRYQAATCRQRSHREHWENTAAALLEGTPIQEKGQGIYKTLNKALRFVDPKHQRVGRELSAGYAAAVSKQMHPPSRLLCFKVGGDRL